MNRKLCIASFVLPWMASIANAGIVTVRFDPPETMVTTPGEIFTVNLVADIPDPVVGWGLDLTISTPGIVSLFVDPIINLPWVSVTASDGDKLAALADPFSDVDGNGLLGSVSGVGIVLATLTFSVDVVGRTDLVLSTTPGDLTEGFPLTTPGDFATVSFQPGKVVPEPIPLFSLILFAFALLTVRRARQSP